MATPAEPLIQQTEAPQETAPQAAPPVAAPEPAPVAAPPPEYHSKIAELENQIRQYQTTLGQYMQQQSRQPAAPAADPYEQLASKFDKETQDFINLAIERKARQIAEETGHRFMTQAQHRAMLAEDKELYNTANQIYSSLKSDPLWSTMPEVNVQSMAIAQARAELASRKAGAVTAQQTQQQVSQVARTQAAAASLPGTGNQPATIDDRERFVRQWMAQPENQEMFKRFNRGLSLNSPEGQAEFRKTAEYAYKPTQFGGAVGMAAQLLSQEGFEVIK